MLIANAVVIIVVAVVAGNAVGVGVEGDAGRDAAMKDVESRALR